MGRAAETLLLSNCGQVENRSFAARSGVRDWHESCIAGCGPNRPLNFSMGDRAMLGFIWWIVIGFLAGVLARFLIPGQQPMTWFMTIVLGLLGSIVGGVVSSVVFGTNPSDPGFHP